MVAKAGDRPAPPNFADSLLGSFRTVVPYIWTTRAHISLTRPKEMRVDATSTVIAAASLIATIYAGYVAKNASDRADDAYRAAQDIGTSANELAQRAKVIAEAALWETRKTGAIVDPIAMWDNASSVGESSIHNWGRKNVLVNAIEMLAEDPDRDGKFRLGVASSIPVERLPLKVKSERHATIQIHHSQFVAIPERFSLNGLRPSKLTLHMSDRSQIECVLIFK